MRVQSIFVLNAANVVRNRSLLLMSALGKMNESDKSPLLVGISVVVNLMDVEQHHIDVTIHRIH